MQQLEAKVQNKGLGTLKKKRKLANDLFSTNWYPLSKLVRFVTPKTVAWSMRVTCSVFIALAMVWFEHVDIIQLLRNLFQHTNVASCSTCLLKDIINLMN